MKNNIVLKSAEDTIGLLIIKQAQKKPANQKYLAIIKETPEKYPLATQWLNGQLNPRQLRTNNPTQYTAFQREISQARRIQQSRDFNPNSFKSQEFLDTGSMVSSPEQEFIDTGSMVQDPTEDTTMYGQEQETAHGLGQPLNEAVKMFSKTYNAQIKPFNQAIKLIYQTVPLLDQEGVEISQELSEQVKQLTVLLQQASQAEVQDSQFIARLSNMAQQISQTLPQSQTQQNPQQQTPWAQQLGKGIGNVMKAPGKGLNWMGRQVGQGIDWAKQRGRELGQGYSNAESNQHILTAESGSSAQIFSTLELK